MRTDQEILEQVKGKGGFMKLSMEEKIRYRELKPKTDEEQKIVADQKFDAQPTITISKDELSKLIADEVNKVKQDGRGSSERQARLGEWSVFTPEKPGNKMARVGIYRATTEEPYKVITDWKFIKYDYDENTRKYDKPIYKLTLTAEDNSISEVEVDWIRWNLELKETEPVELVEEKKEKIVRNMGKVLKPLRKDGYVLSRGIDTPNMERRDSAEWADMFEIADRVIYRAKTKEGKVYTINANRINP